MRHRSTLAVLTCLILAASPALARPGGWRAPGWGGSDWRGEPASSPRVSRDRSREGRVEVNRFVGENPAALGHGQIAVTSATEGQDYVPQSDRAFFEAAVIDRLVHAGCDTQARAPNGQGARQVAELHVTRSVVEPAETKRKPVSGEAAMSVGNRGSAYGLALAVNLSKPLPALVSTRIEARIRDRATNTVLWEGRAEVATREGDSKWSEQAIAARLAEALFDGFPNASDAAPSRVARGG